MNDGSSFEEQVSSLYKILLTEDKLAKISRNERVSGPDGERETDIIIRRSIADFNITTVIECKDYKRPVTVEKIDAFQSKLNDIGANKGIIVARSGFSRSALTKAKRLSIDACTVDLASNLIRGSRDDLPIIHRRIEFENFRVTMRPGRTGFGTAMRVDVNCLFNDLGVMDLLLRVDPIEFIRNKSFNLKVEEILNNEEVYYRTPNGEMLPVASAILEFDLASALQFGYLSEIPRSIGKINHLDDSLSVWCNFEDVSQVVSNWTQYREYTELPEYVRSFFLSVVSCPKRIDSVGSIRLEAYKY